MDALTDKLINSEPRLRITDSTGFVYPDPNLIFNIDHLISFIKLELDTWKEQSEQFRSRYGDQDKYLQSHHLCSNEHIRKHMKCLFSVSVFYITAFDAIDQLTSQLNYINRTLGTKIKKPSDNIDKVFFNKVKYVRDICFIHQNSSKEGNVANKRTAMTWTPTIKGQIDKDIDYSNYVFPGGNWYIKTNGIRLDSDLDIEVENLNEYTESY